MEDCSGEEDSGYLYQTISRDHHCHSSWTLTLKRKRATMFSFSPIRLLLVVKHRSWNVLVVVVVRHLLSHSHLFRHRLEILLIQHHGSLCLCLSTNQSCLSHQSLHNLLWLLLQKLCLSSESSTSSLHEQLLLHQSLCSKINILHALRSIHILLEVL